MTLRNIEKILNKHATRKTEDCAGGSPAADRLLSTRPRITTIGNPK